MYDYAMRVDKAPSKMVEDGMIAVVRDDNDYEARMLLHYAQEFDLLRKPEIVKVLTRNEAMAVEWLYALKEKKILKDEDVASIRESLIREGKSKGLSEMLRHTLIDLTPQILDIVLRLPRLVNVVPTPAKFDRAIWKVACTVENDLLVRWKRKLKDHWTEDISLLERSVKRLKSEGKNVEARMKSKECAALKAWAHGILVDYKRVVH